MNNKLAVIAVAVLVLAAAAHASASTAFQSPVSPLPSNTPEPALGTPDVAHEPYLPDTPTLTPSPERPTDTPNPTHTPTPRPTHAPRWEPWTPVPSFGLVMDNLKNHIQHAIRLGVQIAQEINK
jgi:hypothetical protein